jgi:hypothetical protein
MKIEKTHIYSLPLARPFGQASAAQLSGPPPRPPLVRARPSSLRSPPRLLARPRGPPSAGALPPPNPDRVGIPAPAAPAPARGEAALPAPARARGPPGARLWHPWCGLGRPWRDVARPPVQPRRGFLRGARRAACPPVAPAWCAAWYGATPCQRSARPVWHAVCSPGVTRRGARCPRRGPAWCAVCPARPAIGVLVPRHGLHEDRQRSPGAVRAVPSAMAPVLARPGSRRAAACGRPASALVACLSVAWRDVASARVQPACPRHAWPARPATDAFPGQLDQ